MRVLMLTNAFHPCPQSASQRVSSFAKVLCSEGFEVVVVTVNRCIEKIGEVPSDRDITVYDLKCPRLLLYMSNLIINPVILLLLLFLSVVIAIEKRVDVVLPSVPNGETAITGFFVSKLFRSSLVIDIRDLYPPPPVELPFLNLHTPSRINDFLTDFFSFLYRNSSRLTCVDKNIKQKVIALGVESENILVIPNGADTRVYVPCDPKERERIRAKNGFSSEDFIFVYAGSLIWYYPVQYAILGFARSHLKGTNSRLLVISPMSYVPHKKLAEKLELEDCVEFRGPLSVGQTAEILSCCDVGLVVYRGEDYFKSMYGSKIFSYMSCGLAILASGPRGSVIDAIIRKYKVGFFIGKPTKKSFEKGFSHFLSNIRNAGDMGANARQTVENSYDRQKLGLRLTALIAEMCENK